MKKFILMIFAVSIFFTGLGGIVKQIGLCMDSGEIAFISTQQPENVEKNIKFSKPFKVVRHDGKPIIIKSDSKEFRFDHLQINPPNQIGRALEFKHRIQLEPTRQIEDLRRGNGKNLIIIKRNTGEKTETPENKEIEVTPVRVLIEKQNKSE
jgi:hypothetical protein